MRGYENSFALIMQSILEPRTSNLVPRNYPRTSVPPYPRTSERFCISMSNITVNSHYSFVDDAKVETKKSQCNKKSRTVKKCGNNGKSVGMLVRIIQASHQI